jgi:hypothetical protein
MGGGVGGVPTPSRKFPPTTPISYCAPKEVNSPQPSVVRPVIRIPAEVEAEGRAIPGSRSGSWGDRAMSEVHASRPFHDETVERMGHPAQSRML